MFLTLDKQRIHLFPLHQTVFNSLSRPPSVQMRGLMSRYHRVLTHANFIIAVLPTSDSTAGILPEHMENLNRNSQCQVLKTDLFVHTPWESQSKSGRESGNITPLSILCLIEITCKACWENRLMLQGRELDSSWTHHGRLHLLGEARRRLAGQRSGCEVTAVGTRTLLAHTAISARNTSSSGAKCLYLPREP